MLNKKMSISFDIDTILPTLNEYINVERGNKFRAAALKKKYSNICGLYALPIKNKLDPKGLYSLVLNWKVENNRSDPDNIYFGVKFVLDGLVEQGILEKDGRKNIKNIHHNIETTNKYNLEVILIKDNDKSSIT